MALKRYNNLLTSGIWYNKYPKDDKTLDIVVVTQKFSDDSKKLSEKSNKYSTKGEPAYIRYLPPWMMEEPKGVVGEETKNGKKYWWHK